MASKTVVAEPTRLRDLASGRTDLMKMDPALIKIEKGHNPRDYRLPENRAHLNSLKISIASQKPGGAEGEIVGVIQPLICRFDGGQCVLLDGESRLTAVLELIKEGTPIVTVPVIQVTATTPADRIAVAIGANTGKPLSEWELGGGFKRLESFGWTPEMIASRFGVSTQKVVKCIELADMPQDVKQLLSERAITPALAITTIRRARAKKDSTIDDAAAELKSEVAKRKASGKKGPAKAAKKATGVKAEGKAVELLRLIFQSLEKDFYQEKNQEGGFVSEYFYVSLNHAKKMEKLVYPDGK